VLFGKWFDFLSEKDFTFTVGGCFFCDWVYTPIWDTLQDAFEYEEPDLSCLEQLSKEARELLFSKIDI